MRTLTFVRPGDLQWLEAAEPSLSGPLSALVSPVAVAVCDLDWETLGGRTPFAGPFPFGHEAVARVVAVGDAVKGFRPGDLVIVPFQISCGTCGCCARGRTADCETVEPVARTSMYGFGAFGGPWGGALSDPVHVPFADAMLVAVPSNVTAEAVASVADNAADGWRAIVENLAEPSASRVLVVGGGLRSIGLYAVAAARAVGVAEVFYADNDVNRLEQARSLGAAVIERRGGKVLGSFDLTVDASMSEDGLMCALASTRRGGTCQCVSLYYQGKVAMPLIQMYADGVDFRIGRANVRPAIPAVLAAIASGAMRADLVVSRVASWDDAIPALKSGPTSKLVIVRR